MQQGKGRVRKGVAVGRLVLLVAAIVTAIGVSGGVAVAKSSGATVKASDAWARTSPMEAKNGAVHMVLENSTKKDNALVAAVDNDFTQAFRSRGVPTSVLLDSAGAVVRRWPGGIPLDDPETQRVVKRLVREANA